MRYAEENGLKRICLTDHFWDDNAPGMPDLFRDREYDPNAPREKIPDRGLSTARWYRIQNYAHISRALPLPKSDKVNFMFGAETELQYDLKLGVTREMIDRLDFVIIPTTHLHMGGLTMTAEQMASAEGRAGAWITRLEGVLDKDLPFGKIGIAHLACSLVAPSPEDRIKVMQLLNTEDLERVFAKAARVGVGIELNMFDMLNAIEGETEILLRPFRIAKAQGCKFYLGSDAHKPCEFSRTREIFERAVELLDLSESDKFHISK